MKWRALVLITSTHTSIYMGSDPSSQTSYLVRRELLVLKDELALAGIELGWVAAPPLRGKSISTESSKLDRWVLPRRKPLVIWNVD
jgi:hypothetical protein